MGEETLRARAGDVLVVSYPEVKIQVAPFSTVGVGSAIYTRQLLEGEQVQEQYDRIYNWLKAQCEGSARDKVELWTAELRRKDEVKEQKPIPPKPAQVAPKPPAIPPAIPRTEGGSR